MRREEVVNARMDEPLPLVSEDHGLEVLTRAPVRRLVRPPFTSTTLFLQSPLLSGIS